MLSSNIKELFLCRLREFIREPTACIFVILMPILWMLLLGFIIPENQAPRYHVGLSNAEQTSPQLLSKIKDSLKRHKDIYLEDNSLVNLKKKLEQNKLSLIIYIENDVPTYIYNPNDLSSLLSKNYIDRILQESFGQRPTLKTREMIFQPQSKRYIDFLVPGLLALSLLTTSLFGTGMTIVLHRKQQLLKRYMITPMPIKNYMISHLLGRYTIMIIELLAILLFAFFVFDVKINGSLSSFLCLCSLGTLTFTSLAILLSSRVKNTGTYNGFVNLLVAPMMLLSGIWFSRQHFPIWCQNVTDYLPLSALVDALRKTTQQGLTLSEVIPECTVLFLYLIPSLLLSKKYFRWC